MWARPDSRAERIRNRYDGANYLEHRIDSRSLLQITRFEGFRFAANDSVEIRRRTRSASHNNYYLQCQWYTCTHPVCLNADSTKTKSGSDGEGSGSSRRHTAAASLCTPPAGIQGAKSASRTSPYRNPNSAAMVKKDQALFGHLFRIENLRV